MKHLSRKMKLLVIVFMLILTACGYADQWEHIGLSDKTVISLESHYMDQDNIYAGTLTDGLYVTYDDGDNWYYRIATNVPITYLGADPHMPQAIYALVYDSWSAGLYYSIDNGNVWLLIEYLTNPRRLGFDCEFAGHFYICAPYGVMTSDNYGADFQPANDGLVALNILDIMGHGANTNQAYAVGETFVSRTTDFGSNWGDLGGLFGLEDYNPACIASDPIRPDTIYVACWAYLARSFDGGDSWEYTLLPTVANEALACSPTKPGMVYVGSDGGGVLVSYNAGASFRIINENLGNLNVHSLNIDSEDRLLAGTDNGVYAYEVTLDVSDHYKSIPDRIALSQNYPNPFNASTAIKYEISCAADVTIEIYDIVGRQVTTLVDKYQQAGYHQAIWNAEDLPSGVYFYKLQAADYTESRKMILLK